MDREDEFRAFDKLPKAYRDLLNYSNLNFGVLSLKRQFFRYDVEESVPMVKNLIEQKQKQACFNDYGSSHPFVSK